MKITITGSLGNIGKYLAKQLLANDNEVTIISSSTERQNEIEQLGAKAAIGSITNVDFLTNAFIDADAVFLMTPPNMGGQNIINNTIEAGKAYAEAVKKAGIKKIVMLSSIGADYENGTGPIVSLNKIEKIYSELKNTSVTYLRAGYFYTNFYNDIPLIKNLGIQGSNFPAETELPLVHPSDIANAATEELQSKIEGNNIRYIVSDFVKASDITKAFGNTIKKTGLHWVEFTNEQAKEGMLGAGIPQEIADLYTEMGVCLKTGKLQSDFIAQGKPITGKIKLDDFAKEFVSNF